MTDERTTDADESTTDTDTGTGTGTSTGTDTDTDESTDERIDESTGKPTDEPTDAGAERPPDGVLSPEELTLEDEEQVRPLGDDRYVVSTEDGPPAGRAESSPSAERRAADGRQIDEHSDRDSDREGDGHRNGDSNRDSDRDGGGHGDADEEPRADKKPRAVEGPRAVEDQADLAATDGAYAIDLTVTTDRGVARGSFQSHDISEVVGETLRWYARQVEPELPPDEVLSILLRATDIEFDRQ